jgi:hypothetical protein
MIAIFLLLPILVVDPLITISTYAQGTSKTSVEYIENARALLKQASTEYKNGNYVKADELVSNAYLDNFEYVEADLNNNGHSQMVTEMEKLIVDDLRGMIKDRVPQAQLDSEISLIDSKLSQAIAVVPEFPMAASFAVMGSIIASVIIIGRIKGSRNSGTR